jgi:dTMP kinase
MTSNLNYGKLIVFEGGEACGKTTQIELLKNKYKNNNNFVFTKEPGGTKVAEEIRKIIITGDADKILPKTELALIYAARNEHYYKKILPALQEGKNVICDRFILSSFVYQGKARGLEPQYIQEFHNLFFAQIKPDITLLLDIDVNIAKKRIAERNNKDERFEKFPSSFHQEIRQAYLDYASNDMGIKIINANLSPQEISQKIKQLLDGLLQ